MELMITTQFEARPGSGQPSRAVYVRRRLIVSLLFAALLVMLGITARSALADRGGVPASIPAIRPASPAASSIARPPPLARGVTAATPPVSHLVQPGETLWSIAGALHGDIGLTDYLDRLVTINGGAGVQAGQLLTLP